MDNEVVVLLALHLELKAQGAERVLMDAVLRKTNYLFGVQQMTGLKTSVFREIVKRLQAFGLLTLQIESQDEGDEAEKKHQNRGWEQRVPKQRI